MAKRFSLMLLMPCIVWSFHCEVPFSTRIGWNRGKPFFVGGNSDREILEQELKIAREVIQEIDILQETIQDEDADTDQLKALFDSVEQRVDQLTSAPISPAGLSMEDFQSAIRAYATLPLSLKLGLYNALDMNAEGSVPYPTVAQIPEIVARLYEQRQQLTVKKLEDSVQQAQKILQRRTDTTYGLPAEGKPLDADDFVAQLLGGKNVDQVQLDNVVKQQLGRVTRKESNIVTARDLETLMGVLADSSLFVVRGKAEAIPGGYVVRGVNAKKSPKELIASLDKKLPLNWNAQVSLLPDITTSGFNQPEGTKNGDAVLVLLNKDFSSESAWIFPISAGLAAVTTFLYGISVYSKNENIATQLADRSALGDFSGIDVFNGHLFDVLFPLAIIQLLHEAGHILIARKDEFDISVPTPLPFYDKLPNLGFRTNLMSSPPNLTSLFDFALIGPFMGIATSIILLVYGVQATLIADPEALKYFPALTVEEIRLSSLGSVIIDFLFGGSGVITSQNPGNSVSLHPFAVGGFAGLIIQAVEMLPLGSTDGGRISQAIFGRSGHLLVGGATWFALLVATVFVDQSSDILLGAWALNNVAQNDMEIPCREEVTKVDIFRSAAGFGLYAVALLAILPLQ